MSSIVLCNRITGKPSRSKLNDVNLKSKAFILKKLVSAQINSPTDDFELIYGGKRLLDDEIVETYGVKAGCTIHVTRKQSAEKMEPKKLNKEDVNQAVTALQTAFMNPAFRNMIVSMLSEPETIKNIIADTPSLESDPIAIAMLQDPELLAIIAAPSNVNKVIEAHPALGEAAIYMAATLNNPAAMAASETTRSARGTYSLARMNDEDGAETHPRQVAVQPITASQLAAALAATTGALSSAPPGGQTPSSSHSQQPLAQPQSFASLPGASGLEVASITDDFFRQAMQQAQNTSLDSQVQQMRDMGITDEALARRALEATAGNLQAAIELIFGDGI